MNLVVVTGTLGAGKTLNTLDHVYKTYRDGDEKEKWRPIYFWGIEGVDHEFFGSEELEDAHDWVDLPPGAVVVIDEAHETFPLRMAGNKVPPAIQEMAKARHHGVNLILITQAAEDLDVFIRRRATGHIHYSRVLGHDLCRKYEYAKFTSDPEGHFETKKAISIKPVKYPSYLFGKYKSAEIHTVKKRYPWRLFIVPVGLGLLAFCGWLAYSTMMNSDAMEAIEQDRTNISTPMGVPNTGPVTASHFTLEGWTDRYKPSVPGLIHSAPIYHKVLEAKTWPRPYCITYQDKLPNDTCKCVTQQATTYEATEQACRYWAKHGFFDHTKDERRESEGGERASVYAARPPSRVNTQVVEERSRRDTRRDAKPFTNWAGGATSKLSPSLKE